MAKTVADHEAHSRSPEPWVPAARTASPVLAVLQLARAVLGVACLTVPSRTAALMGAGKTGTAIRVARILGARHIAQGLATGVHPPGTVLALGAEADATHAATMLALGMISRRWRRPAMRDALIAAALAGAGLAAARSAPPPGPSPSLQGQLAGWLAERLVPAPWRRATIRPVPSGSAVNRSGLDTDGLP